jgi:hypothetical protein
MRMMALVSQLSTHEQLPRLVSGDAPFRPLNISPWLAMSLMQKAIRRGKAQLALRAAATLLRDSPERLWRRLLVTAFEDIGVADLATLSLAVTAQAGKKWRASVGGDWTVASHIIRRMAHAGKCRTADDLAVVCDWHPGYDQARIALTSQTVEELISLAAERASLPERALALWYAVGIGRCLPPQLGARRRDFRMVFDMLREASFHETVVELAREGFRKSREVLPLHLVLLWRDAE